MIPNLSAENPDQLRQIESLLADLRLDAAQLAAGGKYATETTAVRGIIADVAARGDVGFSR